MKTKLLLLCAVFGGAMPSALWSQSLPGTRLEATWRLHSITRTGDTTRIAFSLRNSSSSIERLASFTLDAPAPMLAVAPPSPAEAWDIGTVHRGRRVAQWVSLDRIAAGDSTPSIVVSAVGLPGVVSAWYRGDGLPSEFEDDSVDIPLDPRLRGDVDPLEALSVRGRFVGVYPLPVVVSRSTLSAHAQAQTAAACEIGWVSSQAACATLEGYLGLTAPRLLDAQRLLNEAREPAGGVNEVAYLLLTANVSAARDFLDIPGVRLTYLCGNRFRLRNPNYVELVVTFDVYGKGETGSVVLPARDSDQQAFTETVFETTQRGTVRVFYAGRLIQTKANGGAPC